MGIARRRDILVCSAFRHLEYQTQATQVQHGLKMSLSHTGEAPV
jgi:hypothetical protein